MKLQIASLNVRGIGNNAKRREVFNWLRAKKFSIYMLQEVHCSENTTDSWTRELGYKALFSCCSSSKAGVSILCNNNFNLNVIKTLQDPNGRFIICDIEADGKLLTLANIYAPKKDDPNFFDTFFDRLSCFECDDVVISGDFNLVLDVENIKRTESLEHAKMLWRWSKMQWKIWNCVMFGEFLIQIVKDTSGARDSQKFIADLIFS